MNSFQKLSNNLLNFFIEHYALIVSIFSLSIRIMYILFFTQIDTYVHSDAAAYHNRAEELLFNTEPSIHSTYWPPLFSVFLSEIFYIAYKLNIYDYRVHLTLLITAVLNIISFFILFHLIRKIFDTRSAQVFLFLVSLWYPLIYMNIFLMSENLFIPLLYIAVFLIITLKRSTLGAAIIGLLLGIIAVLRSEFLIFVGMYLLWNLIRKRQLIHTFSIALFFLGVIALVSIYNNGITNGKTTFISSGGGFNFALTWCDLKSIEFNLEGGGFGFLPPANINYPEHKRLYTDREFYDQGYYYEIGINCIKDSPEILLKNLDNARNVFHSYIFPRYDSIEGGSLIYQIFKIFGIFMTIAAAYFGIINYSSLKNGLQRDMYELFGMLFLGFLVAVYIQNPGEERYLIPYLPVLIIIVSVQISSFLKETVKS